MSASLDKKHKVLLLGAGFVSRPTLEYLTKRKDTVVTVVTFQQSEIDVLSNYDATNPVLLDVNKEKDRLVELIKDHELVISLLPHTMHAPIVEACIEHRKNMVTASYVSKEIEALHDRAVEAGVTIAMEAGLDPGIDHMLAMQCFDQIKSNDGKVVSFISWCGGLPAPESSHNPLRYKFSWSPQGVLMVTLAPAKYLQNGELVERAMGGENYRKPPFEISCFPELDLEGVPNRDSTKYIKDYGIESVHTIMRGTLRYKGFIDAIVGLQQLGLINMNKNKLLSSDAPDITWKQLLPKLLEDQRDQIADEELQDIILNQVDHKMSRLKAINQLGLLCDEPVAKLGTTMAALCELLTKKLAYGPDERDMVVMHHEVIGEYSDKTEKHNVSLVMYGETNGHSALSMGTGYPCAIISRMVLQGEIEDKGVVTPLKPHVYKHVLTKLEELGIQAKTEIITHKR